VPQTRNKLPVAGELWLSRPPYVFLTRIRAVTATAERARIEYELLDSDGSTLSGPLHDVLDESWWENFQPLLRREG